jgi:16S rRNA C967 or C1407 C5-methylase (RsmB/RsmF family)
MIQLPDDFIKQIRPVFGEERFERFVKALDEPSPVSIRVNPHRAPTNLPQLGEASEDTIRSTFQHDLLTSLTTKVSPSWGRLEGAVPWCRTGYYLPNRLNFTFDPLLHAGCYYVQEASSMFLDEVLRQHLPKPTVNNGPLCCLDLCAAPGGKSTLLRSALPEDSVLFSNEPVRKRASILLENVVKWGYDQHYVTNAYPRDYRASKLRFDVILCDVPCSGEGMFRKDPDTIKEWSLQNVGKCWQLQREIVSDAWECLNEGGLLIYSTCTYNTKENEENIRWMLSEFDAELLPVETKSEWNITGSLLKDFTAPVYRFIPGYTQGEGLFMAVLRKGSSRPTPNPSLWREGSHHAHLQKAMQRLNILSSPLPPQEGGVGGSVDLSYSQAISYLRGEALVLPPDTPRGLITVSFMGFPLGPVKNIGNRANNLYPKEWRIKSTHIPQDYETIFRLT